MPSKRPAALEKEPAKELADLLRASPAPERDPFKELIDLLCASRVTVTFSRNCCSGIVHVLGKNRRCQCWRCRKMRGQPVTEETERRAEELSRQAQAKMRRRTMRLLKKEGSR